MKINAQAAMIVLWKRYALQMHSAMELTCPDVSDVECVQISAGTMPLT